MAFPVFRKGLEMKKDRIVIGKISGVHGIRGEVTVYPLTDDMTRFYDLEYLLCGGARYGVQEVRLHKGQALVKLNGVDDRTTAEKMKGKLVEVEREDAVALEPGEFFIEDLKGLQVLDTGSERRGLLKDVMQTGAVDILVIELDGAEWMMPFLNRDVPEVNVEEGYIRADLSKCVR